MKSASIHETKKELLELEPARLVELCILLGKYKKENKEYLDYLLFRQHDPNSFCGEVKAQMDELFGAINPENNLYYIKKSYRKILRLLNRYCKYLGDKPLEVELRIHYLKKIKDSGIAFYKSKIIANLYDNELHKLNNLLLSVHEDLRNDYRPDIEILSERPWKV